MSLNNINIIVSPKSKFSSNFNSHGYPNVQVKHNYVSPTSNKKIRNKISSARNGNFQINEVVNVNGGNSNLNLNGNRNGIVSLRNGINSNLRDSKATQNGKGGMNMGDKQNSEKSSVKNCDSKRKKMRKTLSIDCLRNSQKKNAVNGINVNGRSEASSGVVGVQKFTTSTVNLQSKSSKKNTKFPLHRYQTHGASNLNKHSPS
jgi:hypothetical protein